MDSFVVSARKYRPATFDDVVGQGSITTTLRNSILNDHLGHAYLFSGPRGVGKTTCARIYAKTINCGHISEGGEACNTCESCVSFNENRSYSIHELDAASNNSVDDIRTLIEQVRIPPQVGKYSIYIIDEVHMLSAAAFNAFLKTLEEPPAHAIFVLATTEKHKIVPTILSRCQIFDFNRIKVEDAAAYLLRIAKAENISCEEEALHMIALKADGAMRDALSIFDQVVSFAGGTVTYSDVVENLNILDYDVYIRLTTFLLQGDVASSLLLYDDVLSKGFDSRNFINGYASHLRDLMVCKDPATLGLMEVGAGIRDKYSQQAADTPLDFLYQGLDICSQADIQYRSSRNQRLTIELALVKLANLIAGAKKKIAEPGQVQEVENGAEPSPKAVPAGEARPEASHAPPPVKDSLSQAEQAQSATAPQAEQAQPAASPKPVVSGARPSALPGQTSTISIRNSLLGNEPESEASGVTGMENDREQGQADVPASQKQVKATAKQLLDAWGKYLESVREKSPRIYGSIQGNKPVVGANGIMTFRLSTDVQRDHFLKQVKPAAIGFIRAELGLSDLEIHTELSEHVEEKGRIYTDEDRLNHLMDRNPDLKELKQRFNLDFDH